MRDLGFNLDRSCDGKRKKQAEANPEMSIMGRFIVKEFKGCSVVDGRGRDSILIM